MISKKKILTRNGILAPLRKFAERCAARMKQQTQVRPGHEPPRNLGLRKMCFGVRAPQNLTDGTCGRAATV